MERQARSQNFTLGGEQKLRGCTFFSLFFFFSRCPQNLSSPRSGVHIFRIVEAHRTNKASCFPLNPLNRWLGACPPRLRPCGKETDTNNTLYVETVSYQCGNMWAAPVTATVYCHQLRWKMSISTTGRLRSRRPVTDDRACRDLELQARMLSQSDSRPLLYVSLCPMIDRSYWRHRLRHSRSAAVKTYHQHSDWLIEGTHKTKLNQIEQNTRMHLN